MEELFLKRLKVPLGSVEYQHIEERFARCQHALRQEIAGRRDELFQALAADLQAMQPNEQLWVLNSIKTSSSRPSSLLSRDQGAMDSYGRFLANPFSNSSPVEIQITPDHFPTNRTVLCPFNVDSITCGRLRSYRRGINSWCRNNCFPSPCSLPKSLA
jgi:hypothetical protein